MRPIRLILAGRTTRCRKGVDEIGHEAAREALRAVRHLAPERVEVEIAVEQGSPDLRTLFGESTDAPRANDTSLGAGFAPLSVAEQLALAVDAHLGRLASEDADSPFGEDTKVMVVREGAGVRITVAIAMLAHLVADEAAYRRGLSQAREVAAQEARRLGFARCEVAVNAADQASGSFYLTLSGTSAESGDDGQVGRGNRASGLITPMRPMTLEALAGKNPCTHVGKLLSIAASRAAAECARLPGVRAAECLLVSRIGEPVSQPQARYVRLDAPRRNLPVLREEVEAIVERSCLAIPRLWELLLAARTGTVEPGSV